MNYFSWGVGGIQNNHVVFVQSISPYGFPGAIRHWATNYRVSIYSTHNNKIINLLLLLLLLLLLCVCIYYY